MQDLLLNRIRGALKGAAIGEAAAASDRFTWQQVKSGEWFNQQNWPQSRLLISAVEQTIDRARSRPIDRSLALDWLPIALFFHEDSALLRQQIDRAGQTNAIDQAITLALSEAIALALREELLIDQLLPRLSEWVAPVSSIVSHQLLQVQAWLDSEASLAMVERSILPLPAPLARLSLSFYGWLSVPQDFNLALLRSQGSSAAVWLGALAGADQGVGGIAIDWGQPFSFSTAHPIWQTEILEPIDRLANQLVATWAGVDAIAPAPFAGAMPFGERCAIGAAGLIRPR